MQILFFSIFEEVILPILIWGLIQWERKLLISISCVVSITHKKVQIKSLSICITLKFGRHHSSNISLLSINLKSSAICKMLCKKNKLVSKRQDKWHVETQIALATRALAHTHKLYSFNYNTCRHVIMFRLVLPIDIENPYRLSNCLYRYISIYIGFLATNF